MELETQDSALPQPQNAESGQSLVEFAVSIVFIFFLLAGIIDLGRAFLIYMSLRDAAQEGAIYGSFCPHDLNGILARVRDASPGTVADLNAASFANDTSIRVDCFYLLPGGQTACTSAAGSITEGNRIRVSVVYKNFNITMPFIGAVAGQGFPIQAAMVTSVLSTGCPISPP